MLMCAPQLIGPSGGSLDLDRYHHLDDMENIN